MGAHRGSGAEGYCRLPCTALEISEPDYLWRVEFRNGTGFCLMSGVGRKVQARGDQIGIKTTQHEEAEYQSVHIHMDRLCGTGFTTWRMAGHEGGMEGQLECPGQLGRRSRLERLDHLSLLCCEAGGCRAPDQSCDSGGQYRSGHSIELVAQSLLYPWGASK